MEEIEQTNRTEKENLEIPLSVETMGNEEG
jgi:hypothetical protein